jgi:Family of unknown function (DUF6266)
MAKIDRLPFNLSGQLGDFVYYKWKDKNVVRKKPAPRTTAPSPTELQARSKFGFMTKFLLPLNSLFYKTFRYKNMSAMNKALSVNMNHVIPESYPDWRVDFSKLILGQGDAARLTELTVHTHVAGHLIFNWNGRSLRRGAAGKDLVYVALYCEHLNQWLTHLGSVYRKDGSFVLDAEPFSGFPVHVYLGLISDFWHGSSDSQYLGTKDIG